MSDPPVPPLPPTPSVPIPATTPTGNPIYYVVSPDGSEVLPVYPNQQQQDATGEDSDDQGATGGDGTPRPRPPIPFRIIQSQSEDHEPTIMSTLPELPSFKGDIGGKRVDPSISTWTRLLEEEFVRKNITSETKKLIWAKRHISQTEGTAHLHIYTDDNLSKAPTWNQFKYHLGKYYQGESTKQPYSLLSDFFDTRWEQGEGISEFSAKVQMKLMNISLAMEQQYRIPLDKNAQKVLQYGIMYHNCQQKFRNIIQDKDNFSLSDSERIAILNTANNEFLTGSCRRYHQQGRQQPHTNNIRESTATVAVNFQTGAKAKNSYPSPHKGNPPASSYTPKGWNKDHVCTRCERLGHLAVVCRRPSFCGKCRMKNHHLRGETDFCRGSTFDPKFCKIISGPIPGPTQNYSSPSRPGNNHHQQSRPSSRSASPNVPHQFRSYQNPQYGRANCRSAEGDVFRQQEYTPNTENFSTVETDFQLGLEPNSFSRAQPVSAQTRSTAQRSGNQHANIYTVNVAPNTHNRSIGPVHFSDKSHTAMPNTRSILRNQIPEQTYYPVEYEPNITVANRFSSLQSDVPLAWLDDTFVTHQPETRKNIFCRTPNKATTQRRNIPVFPANIHATDSKNLPKQPDVKPTPHIGKSYIIDAIVEGVPAGLLMDSGAQISLLKASFLHKLMQIKQRKFQLSPTNLVIRGLRDGPLPTLGWVTLNFTVADVPFSSNFVVVDSSVNFDTEILLGSDALNSLPWLFSFQGNGKMYIKTKDPKNSILIDLKISRASRLGIEAYEPIEDNSPNTDNSTYCHSYNEPSDEEFRPSHYCHCPQGPSGDRISRVIEPQTRLPDAMTPEFSNPEFQMFNPSEHSTNTDDSFEQGVEVFSLHIRDKVFLEPFSRHLIPVQVKGIPGQRVSDALQLVTEKTQILANVAIAQSLDVVHDETILVECINMNPEQKYLSKNSKIGNAFLAISDFSEVSSDTANVCNLTESNNLNATQLKQEYRNVLQESLKGDPESYVLADDTQTDNLLNFLVKNRDVITLSGDPIGRTSLMEFNIDLLPGTKPIFVPPYRIPHSQQIVLEKHLDEMLLQGVIEPSVSPWNAPLLLVKKKDGCMRPCVDFRRLNSHIIPDRFPIPNMQETLQNIGAARVFTSCDLVSAYWQLRMEESSRQYTAFSTNRGHFQFCSLPYGVRSGPAKFSRLMELALSGVLGTSALLYLDDIVVFSKDIPEHYQKLNNVFQKLREAQLKLKLSKCRFFRRSLVFLGCLISEKGIQPDPQKIDVLKSYPEPKDVQEIMSFIGFSGFYRHMIPNFSKTAKPLTDLLKKNAEFIWGPAQQIAFMKLIDQLVMEPVLQFPDYTKPFIIATDASGYGIGAVLSQLDRHGKELPVAFASRLMSKAERNYGITEKEGLAVVFGLSKFRNIVYGYPLTIYVDHKPLEQLFKDKHLDGRMARWAIKVSSYNPIVIHRPGTKNKVPDYLSRINKPSVSIRLTKTFESLDRDTIRRHQDKDDRIQTLKRTINKGTNNNFPYSLWDGIVCFHAQNGQRKIELPESLEDNAIILSHAALGSGHFGHERTQIRLEERYHFPGMAAKVKEYCSECTTCLQNKGPPPKQAPIHQYPLPTLPWENVGMDILGPFKRTRCGNQYVLVFTDRLTRYSEYVAIPDRSAPVIAKSLIERVITLHSTPSTLLSDNAGEFMSQLFQQLSKMCRINKVQITSYHPSANGLLERQNAKILAFLRTTINFQQSDWDMWIPWAQTSINSSYNDSVGDNPHFLLYHYDKRLPFDMTASEIPRLVIGEPLTDFNADIYERAAKIFERTRQFLKERSDRMVQNQHQRIPEPRDIKPGMRCFLRALVPPGNKAKLSPKWYGPFRIMRDLGMSRFEVMEIGTRKTKIVHADQLKLVSEPRRPDNVPTLPNPSSSSKKQVRFNLPPDSNDDFDDDDDYYYSGSSQGNVPPRGPPPSPGFPTVPPGPVPPRPVPPGPVPPRPIPPIPAPPRPFPPLPFPPRPFPPRPAPPGPVLPRTAPPGPVPPSGNLFRPIPVGQRPRPASSVFPPTNAHSPDQLQRRHSLGDLSPHSLSPPSDTEDRGKDPSYFPQKFLGSRPRSPVLTRQGLRDALQQPHDQQPLRAPAGSQPGQRLPVQPNVQSPVNQSSPTEHQHGTRLPTTPDYGEGAIALPTHRPPSLSETTGTIPKRPIIPDFLRSTSPKAGGSGMFTPLPNLPFSPKQKPLQSEIASSASPSLLERAKRFVDRRPPAKSSQPQHSYSLRQLERKDYSDNN